MEQDFSHLIKEEETSNDPASPPLPATQVEWFHARLLRVFGWRFLVFLCVTQCLLKGLAIAVVISLTLPLFKQLIGADAATLQLALLVIELPWSIKPLFGLLADLVRVGGYHNRYWLLVSLATGTGCATLGLVMLRSGASEWTFIMALMGIHFQIALYDLLSEGCYSARMRDNPESGSDVVNFVQYLQLGGGIVARLLVGPLADAGQFTVVFALLIAFCMAPLAPTLAGWLPEQRHVGDKRCVTLVPPPPANRGMIAIIAFTGCAAPVVTLLANLWDPVVGAATALLLVCAALVGAFFLFPPILARIALFQALTALSAPQLGSAMDFFYTADEACLPGGPHFSYAYYMSVAGVVGSAASLAGALLYQLTLSKLRFRTVFVLTTLLGSAIGASDLILVLRLNVVWGIPDRWAYLVGEAIMEPALVMLNYIPMSTLLSKGVPPGLESSVFAFNAGLKNFCGLVAGLSGALLYEAAGVRTVLPCEWGALWWLVVLCHVALPALVGVPAAWLIPNTAQNEELY